MKQLISEDTEISINCDPAVRYIQYQIEDFPHSLGNGKDPAVTGKMAEGLYSYSPQSIVAHVIIYQLSFHLNRNKDLMEDDI